MDYDSREQSPTCSKNRMIHTKRLNHILLYIQYPTIQGNIIPFILINLLIIFNYQIHSTRICNYVPVIVEEQKKKAYRPEPDPITVCDITRFSFATFHEVNSVFMMLIDTCPNRTKSPAKIMDKTSNGIFRECNKTHIHRLRQQQKTKSCPHYVWQLCIFSY